MGDEELVVDLLNTTPVVAGRPTDLLADPDAAHQWSIAHGGSGTAAEVARLAAVRDVLQSIVREKKPLTCLQPFLVGVVQLPTVTEYGLSWQLRAAPSRQQAARVVVAALQLCERMPGRLRPCGNPDCHLFLLDRSKSNNARWCSMARCGNRLKARRHYQRAQQDQPIH